MVISLIGFFGVLFLAVSIQSMRAQSDRAIDSLDQQIRFETERYLELRADLAAKESPARIMEQARSFGLIDPGPVAPLGAVNPTPSPDAGTAPAVTVNSTRGEVKDAAPGAP